MYLDINQINSLLNDFWNFHLVLFGTGLSMFTLLYSFILTKRDNLKEIADQFKKDGSSPLLSQRESYITKYIQTIKKINDKVVIIICSAFFLFLASWAFHRLVPDNTGTTKIYALNIIATLTLLLLVYLVFMFFRIFKHYQVETNI